MTLFTTDKKKIIALLLLSVILFAGAAVYFGIRLLEKAEIYEVTEYFGGEAAAATMDAPREGEVLRTGGPKDDTAPSMTAGGSKHVPREIAVHATQIGELALDAPEEAGIVRAITVDLPDEALSWTKEGKQPAVGDRIRVRIPDAPEYVVCVTDFSVDQGGMTVCGRLEVLNGECTMHALKGEAAAAEGEISAKLVDRSHGRVYNLYYHMREKKYTVVEIDSSRIPPAER